MVLTSCRNQEVPAPRESTPKEVSTYRPTADYPTLSSNPERESVLESYFDAWHRRAESPGKVEGERSRFLAMYANAYREMSLTALPGQKSVTSDASSFDKRLRILWDLCGVVHATLIPPDIVKQKIHWREPKALHGGVQAPISVNDAMDNPVLFRLENLPPRSVQLLRNLKADSSHNLSFWDFAMANVRQAYMTPELRQWAPGLPFEICGSSEPLTRTVLLSPVRFLDRSPKPDWSLASVAVHEAAHIQWFHRPEVSRDPRLLLPVPNERNAWRIMAQFLRGLRNVTSPPLRKYLDNNATGIRDQLVEAQEHVRRANQVLRLPESDEAMVLRLPDGITENDLRGGNQGPLPRP